MNVHPTTSFDLAHREVTALQTQAENAQTDRTAYRLANCCSPPQSKINFFSASARTRHCTLRPTANDHRRMASASPPPNDYCSRATPRRSLPRAHFIFRMIDARSYFSQSSQSSDRTTHTLNRNADARPPPEIDPELSVRATRAREFPGG